MTQLESSGDISAKAHFKPDPARIDTQRFGGSLDALAVRMLFYSP